VANQFLDAQVRTAVSNQSSTTTTSQTYQQLESILGALNDTNNNGTNLDKRPDELLLEHLANPQLAQSSSVRQQAVASGQTVADDFNQLAGQTNQMRSSLNSQVVPTPAP